MSWFFGASERVGPESDASPPQNIELVVATHDLDIDHPPEAVVPHFEANQHPRPFEHIKTDLEEK
jgi:hypothetical protein